jgi:hypothetical protein
MKKTILVVKVHLAKAPNETRDEIESTLKLYRDGELVASKVLKPYFWGRTLWVDPPAGEFDLVVSCEGYVDSKPQSVFILSGAATQLYFASLDERKN